MVQLKALSSFFTFLILITTIVLVAGNANETVKSATTIPTLNPITRVEGTIAKATVSHDEARVKPPKFLDTEKEVESEQEENDDSDGEEDEQEGGEDSQEETGEDEDEYEDELKAIVKSETKDLMKEDSNTRNEEQKVTTENNDEEVAELLEYKKSKTTAGEDQLGKEKRVPTVKKELSTQKEILTLSNETQVPKNLIPSEVNLGEKNTGSLRRRDLKINETRDTDKLVRQVLEFMINISKNVNKWDDDNPLLVNLKQLENQFNDGKEVKKQENESSSTTTNRKKLKKKKKKPSTPTPTIASTSGTTPCQNDAENCRSNYFPPKPLRRIHFGKVNTHQPSQDLTNNNPPVDSPPTNFVQGSRDYEIGDRRYNPYENNYRNKEDVQYNVNDKKPRYKYERIPWTPEFVSTNKWDWVQQTMPIPERFDTKYREPTREAIWPRERLSSPPLPGNYWPKARLKEPIVEYPGGNVDKNLIEANLQAKQNPWNPESRMWPYRKKIDDTYSNPFLSSSVSSPANEQLQNINYDKFDSHSIQQRFWNLSTRLNDIMNKEQSEYQRGSVGSWIVPVDDFYWKSHHQKFNNVDKELRGCSCDNDNWPMIGKPKVKDTEPPEYKSKIMIDKIFNHPSKYQNKPSKEMNWRKNDIVEIPRVYVRNDHFHTNDPDHPASQLLDQDLQQKPIITWKKNELIRGDNSGDILEQQLESLKPRHKEYTDTEPDQISPTSTTKPSDNNSLPPGQNKVIKVIPTQSSKKLHTNTQKEMLIK